jgi:hypothetical protein
MAWTNASSKGKRCAWLRYLAEGYTTLPLGAELVSPAQHNVFTNAISVGVRHRVSNSLGFASTTPRHLAREVRTFSRFLLNRNSSWRGRSAWGRVIEQCLCKRDPRHPRGAWVCKEG